MQTGSAQHSKGQILVMTTFVLTVLVGFVGLAVDSGYFFDYRRRMVTAADSAALAGAMEVKRNTNSTQVVTVARAAAALNSFTHGTDNITVTVNRPPTSGYHIGSSKFVEVVIDRLAPTFFMRVLGLRTVTVAARSVAGLGDEQACIYVLDPIQKDLSFQVNGNVILDGPSCGIYVNANMKTNNNSAIQASEINVTGSASGGGTVIPSPTTGVPPVNDPFANLQAPSTAGPCLSPTGIGNPPIFNPGVYCSIISLTGTTNAKFNPGLYIIKNGLTINGSIQPSSGVTFYIDGGSVSIAGNGSVALSAPTTGPWEAILFFQNRSNLSTASFTGGPNLQLQGVLYFPSALIKFAGGDSNTGYTQLVSKDLTITGTSAFNTNYASLANGDPIKKPVLSE